MGSFRVTQVVAFSAAALAVLSGSALGAPPPGRQQPQSIQTIDTASYLDANTLLMFVDNTGSFAYDKGALLGRHNGLYFPRLTKKTLMYTAGLWLGAKVNGEVRVSVAEYSDEYTPGPMARGTFQPDNAAFHVYKIRRGDTRASNPDYDEWPFDQGAPAVKDHQGNDSLDAGGSRIPQLLGDQAVWTVFNDADPSRHQAAPYFGGGGLPLGVEVQLYAYASATPCEAGQTIFLQYRIINKGNNTLDSTFVSLWSDPDLGDAIDDLAGCDTSLSLGFCYNAGGDMVYGDTPPSVGLRVLQGPIVPSAVGSAWDAQERMWVPHRRNLPMTAFSKYVNGVDPTNASQAYNCMTGRDYLGAPVINPMTGQTTTFMVSGDPVSGTGWLDLRPSDKRCMPTMGPFQMASGDTQDVVAALVVAAAAAETTHTHLEFGATHVAGQSDGSVNVEIMDAMHTTGHDYEVSFQPNTRYYFTWSLKDLLSNAILLSNQAGTLGEPDIDAMRVSVMQAYGMKDWSIPSGTRRFTWVGADGFGLEGFNGAIGWASPGAFDGGGAGRYMYRLRTVLLKLATTDTSGNFDPNDPNVSYAYRYGRRFSDPAARPEFAPFILNTGYDYPYQDFTKSVPLSAWDVESNPPRRLAVGFLENNVAGGLVDGHWWPPDGNTTDNVANDGPREFLWIFDTAYSTSPYSILQGDAADDILPFMYVLTVARDGNVAFATGDEFLMIRKNPNTDADRFVIASPPPSAPLDTVIVCAPGNSASVVAELRRVSEVARQEFMQGSCACTSLGDVHADGVFDVMDVIAIMDRVFRNRPAVQAALCPVERADFNADGVPNIQDILAAIDYAFMNGTGPRNPCL